MGTLDAFTFAVRALLEETVTHLLVTDRGRDGSEEERLEGATHLPVDQHDSDALQTQHQVRDRDGDVSEDPTSQQGWSSMALKPQQNTVVLRVLGAELSEYSLAI